MKFSTTCKDFGFIAQKLRSAQVFYSEKNSSAFLDRPGPNFQAISLKCLQNVGHEAVYDMYKFRIHSLKTEAAQIFLAI